jgi:hypothetical protein
MDKTSAVILGAVTAACVVLLMLFGGGPSGPPAHTLETVVGVAFCLGLFGIRALWLWFNKIPERLRAEEEIARNTRPRADQAPPTG